MEPSPAPPLTRPSLLSWTNLSSGSIVAGPGDALLPFARSDSGGVASVRLMEISLDHCVIHVSERARSNAFYRDVLGATLVGDADGPAMYRFGSQQLNVHGPGLEPDPVARLPVQPGGSDLCFAWGGTIDAAIDHLRAHGVDVELGPVRRVGARGDGTSVYFRDPDGSLLELISYR